MKVLVSEKLSPHRFKTAEGYLICQDAILARTGKQTYKHSELFNDDDETEIEVDRPSAEVFSEKTLASFENKPVTVEHPSEDVNTRNYKDYSVGFVRDVRKGEVDGQEVMLGTLVITDAQTIEEIENGEHCELSCGYDCDIKDEAEPCQRNIRGNHVALCEQGRAGIARIIDSIEKEKDKVKYYEVTYSGQDRVERKGIIKADDSLTAKKKWNKAHPESEIEEIKEVEELDAQNEMTKGVEFVDSKDTNDSTNAFDDVDTNFKKADKINKIFSIYKEISR